MGRGGISKKREGEGAGWKITLINVNCFVGESASRKLIQMNHPCGRFVIETIVTSSTDAVVAVIV